MLPELYHAHHSHHLEDLPFWLDLASLAGGPILELGCGTGRVLVPLARAGLRCVGLDHDLARLRFLAGSLGQALDPKPDLLAADMRQFHLGRQFSLVILPCNTFSTFDDEGRRSCLERVRQHLRPGGLFAVSMPNPELWGRLPARSELQIEDEFILPESGNPVQVSSSWRRTKSQFAITWIYDQLLPDGNVERVAMQTVHWRNSPETYFGEIQAAGLEIASMYGDFDRSAYAAGSPNLIIMAVA